MTSNYTSPLTETITRRALSSGDAINQKAAAEYLGITPQWLQKLHRAGTAPPSVKVGRERRYLKVSLDAWLAERARK